MSLSTIYLHCVHYCIVKTTIVKVRLAGCVVRTTIIEVSKETVQKSRYFCSTQKKTTMSSAFSFLTRLLEHVPIHVKPLCSMLIHCYKDIYYSDQQSSSTCKTGVIHFHFMIHFLKMASTKF